jgi:hypothetical protein
VARSGESISISGILWTRSPYISELRSPKPQKEGSAICGANCQRSGESTLGISEFSRSRKLGHFKSRNSDIGLGPSISRGYVVEIQTIGGSPDRRSSWCIEVRCFTSPEDEALGTSKVAKSRKAIRAVHLERMHGSDRDLQEKVPIGEPHHKIAHQDIRNPMDVGFIHFGIAMSETPTGDKAAVL